MVCRCLPFLEELLPWAARLILGVFPTTIKGFDDPIQHQNLKKSSSDDVPSWETLVEVLDANEDTPSESFNKTRLRLFGSDEEARLLFYRDTSGWCPFSEKVWIALEEKQISYSVKTVPLSSYGDKPQWFWDINPAGLVPVIDHKGTIVTESLDVLRYIEDNFPDHKKLWPQEGTAERDWIEKVLPLDVQVMNTWSGNLFGNWQNFDSLVKLLDEVEGLLKEHSGPYFLGQNFSIADAMFATTFERVVSTTPYFTGVQVRFARWAAIDTWFEALLTRESFKLIKSDDYTIIHSWKRIGTSRSTPAIELPGGVAWRAAIDGKDGGWDLPLRSVRLPLGSDDGTGADGSKEEAAKILVHNHQDVLDFSLRTLPHKHRAKVELSLRFVATILLLGPEDCIDLLPYDLPQEVAQAVIVLRDNVGVVHDMSFPAARQLRAHLHWLQKNIYANLKQNK